LLISVNSNTKISLVETDNNSADTETVRKTTHRAHASLDANTCKANGLLLRFPGFLLVSEAGDRIRRAFSTYALIWRLKAAISALSQPRLRPMSIAAHFYSWHVVLLRWRLFLDLSLTRGLND